MKISMLSAFAAAENNARHFARRELMQQAAGGCHLLISEAQIAPQVFLPHRQGSEDGHYRSYELRAGGDGPRDSKADPGGRQDLS